MPVMDISNQPATGNVVPFPAGKRNPSSRADNAGETQAYVQPIIELASGRIVGLEFLARRTDPLSGSMQLPSEFMQGMTRQELMQLDLQMAHAVCRFHEETWNQLHGQVSLHLNVSIETLGNPDAFDRLTRKLAGTPFLMQSVVIEVLESPGLNRSALEQLKVLRNLGARIALDDFGTGYSSYERLVDCPLDRIKLDKGLIAHLPHNPRAAQVVKSIVELAGQFGLEVVAEGVENSRQSNWLLTIGCQLAQGFVWQRPAPAAELAAQLANKGNSAMNLAMVAFGHGD